MKGGKQQRKDLRISKVLFRQKVTNLSLYSNCLSEKFVNNRKYSNLHWILLYNINIIINIINIIININIIIHIINMIINFNIIVL